MFETPAAEGATTEVEGAVETAPETTTTDPTGAATEAQTDETDAPRFTIKVGGQEREVTQDELISLAQQGDDYTRKTQAIAAEKQRLASLDALYQALEADPQGTLAALSEAYGINDAAATSEIADPVERELAEMREWRGQVERQARQDAIERELAAVSERYGEVDEEALLQHAISKGIPSLEEAYKSMAYETLRAQRENDATEAKRQAVVVEGGRGQQAGATQPALPEKPSFEEALAAARRSMR